MITCHFLIITFIIIWSSLLGAMEQPTTIQEERAPLIKKAAYKQLASWCCAHTYDYHQSPITGLSFSPTDNNTLVSASTINETAIWNVETHKLIRQIFSHAEIYDRRHPKRLYSLALSHDGEKIATGFSDGSIEIRRIACGHLLKKYFGGRDVTALAFSYTDYLLYAISAWNNGISIWNLRSDKREKFLPIKNSFFCAPPTIAASEQFLAVSDGSFKLFDTQTLQQVDLQKAYNLNPSLQSANCVQCSPDGKTIAVATPTTFSKETIVNLVSLDQNEPISISQYEDQSSRAIHRTNDMAFSPDSQTLAAASIAGTVRLWDTQTGKLTQKWKAHKSQPCISFSRDESLLASGSAGGTIKLWKQLD